jgi:endonuclease/exonuclease/phosphatase (EEP) superfamily protein YafD
MPDARDRARSVARRTVATAVWLSVAVSALALLGASWPPLDAFADLAPIWIATSLALLGATALVDAARTTLAGALLATLAPVLLVAPELIAALRPTSRPAASAPQLTLLTINLWSANQSVDAVDRLIRAENPDIIIAQEAWAPWKGYLESLAPEYRVQAGCRYDSDCNVVILSRLRLIEAIAAPDHGMAAIRLELPARFGAGEVDVLGVHLTRPMSQAAARDQLAQVAAMRGKLAQSVLAAGDFNTTPWSRLRELDHLLPATRRTRAMFTWPTPTRGFTALDLHAPMAIAAIDHVYASDDWRVVELRRGPDVGSDHYPIIASFELVHCEPGAHRACAG